MAAVSSMVVAAIAIGGTVYSGVKSRQEARKQARIAKRAEAAENRKQRVQAYRQARITQAQIAGAEAGAGFSSSGSTGQMAAIASNTNSNISFANQLNSLRSQQLASQRRAQNAEFVGSLAQIPAQAYGAYTGYQQNQALKTQSANLGP